MPRLKNFYNYSLNMAETEAVYVVIGAILSILITAIYDGLRDRYEERRSLKASKEALLDEIQYNLDIVEKESSKEKLFVNIIFFTSVFDSLISSGDFRSFSPIVQRSLQEVYNLMKHNNKQVELIMNLYPTGSKSDSNLTQSYVFLINETKNNLLAISVKLHNIKQIVLNPKRMEHCRSDRSH
jgi:hypothetical protein